MTEVIIKEVSSKKELKQFVKLPFKLYNDNAFWVPPIINDEIDSLTKGKNPAFDFCECKLWLASIDNNVVGRIGVVINSLANEKSGEKMARFTRAEFIDDENVVDKLFFVAEAWAKEMGCIGVHGPLGFSNLDHQAVLVEGFDVLPSAASEYHFDYYHKHFERLGFVKEVDWLEFRLTIPEEIPAKAGRISELVKRRFGLTVVDFKSNDEIKEFAQQVFDIFNEAFDSLFGTFTFNQKMIDFYIKKYFSVLNPKFVKMVKDKDGVLAGFIIGVPSLSKALQKANGKLLPFGALYLKKAIEKPVEMDLFLTGVLPSHANLGVGSILMAELYKACVENGIEYVETTGMLETNHIAIQHWKLYDHVQHKRKRCYRKMY